MDFGLSKITSLLKPDFSASPAKAGVIGVDIGSSSIKIVQLKNVKNTPTLETYGELQLGPYEGIDLGRSTHLPPTKLTEALVDILREAGATGKEALFSLSYSSSFTTIITIPTLDPEQIESMVTVEARKYIPISLTKVHLDWFPLSVHPETKTTNVLITAIYNEALTKYQTILRASNLTIMANEIEIFSAIRSILSPNDTVVAVLDFGASSTRLYIVSKGVIVKTHSILLSGVELTSALKTALNVEFKQAEEIKRDVGLLGRAEDPRIQKTLITALERGLREINTVIKRTEEDEGIHIEKIVLSGSGALLTGLDTYVQDMFSRPIEKADPFLKVAYPAFLEDTLKLAGPSFAVAVGVALRSYQKT